ncbi:nucleoside-diphosphate sugar epimerase/dehydratase [Ahrensia marina]|uniref:polysaccharide biosynthesis protein n=1 Tax=Ahrensia marina TaxID=1514904 RepID=UPI0035D06DCA
MRDLSTLPRPIKSAIVFATDGLLLPLALWMAFGFRLGPFDPSRPLGLVDPFAWIELADVAIIWLGSVGILAGSRLYRIKLHAIDLDAIRRIAVCSATIGFFAATAAFFLQTGAPRSIPVLYGASFFLLAVCVRIAALRFLLAAARFGSNRKPVAIYGAGAAGIQLAASLKQSAELEPVMFIDDNPSLHNVIVSGIRVKPLGTLKKAAKEGRVEQVLIAIPSLPLDRKETLIREMREMGCEVKVVPSYVDLVSGKANLESLIAVDPDDLLGRDKVDLDIPEIAKAYAGRSVMVTGSGGSIGGDLCRQLLDCGPVQLILFDRSEPALYEIERQLRKDADDKNVSLLTILGSVTDRSAIEAALRTNAVDVVLHAAAYKHVPLIETNEVEGARNNVLGTSVVVDACIAAELDRCILVSTDKAVRPTNVMGATKRLAELVVCNAQQRQTKTRFSFVRFGNVLGSSGSVVPLFSKQIASGGPVTVTHPEVTRYFMTVSEAARLVLLAGAYARGDDLFVLDMGKPVKIIDLAKRMIKLSGHTVRDSDDPHGDIPIEITGLRPGEKLYEELLVEDDALTTTPHPKIFRAQTSGVENQTRVDMLTAVQNAVARRDDHAIRSIASAYVEDFEGQRGAENIVRLATPRSISQ